MATKYGDDYVTAESLAEAVIMAVMCLDELRRDEEVESVELKREGNQLIFPGWSVKVVLKRTIGTARWKRDTSSARIFGYMKILDAADHAHKLHPDKDWNRGEFEDGLDERRVKTRLP